jgi:hypothetical protein
VGNVSTGSGSLNTGGSVIDRVLHSVSKINDCVSTYQLLDQSPRPNYIWIQHYAGDFAFQLKDSENSNSIMQITCWVRGYELLVDVCWVS